MIHLYTLLLLVSCLSRLNAMEVTEKKTCLPENHLIEQLLHSFLHNKEEFNHLEKLLPKEMWQKVLTLVITQDSNAAVFQSCIPVDNDTLPLASHFSAVSYDDNCSNVLTGSLNGAVHLWQPRQK